MPWPAWVPDHRKDAVAAQFYAERRTEHPRFITAVLEDARVHSNYRGQPIHPTSRRAAAVEAVRLAVISDTFLAQAMYRAKAHCQAVGVPLLPSIFHRLAIVLGQICIGDPVVVAAGVYFPHGQVVIDGITRIGRGVVIAPFSTVGLKAGDFSGPTIEDQVNIGTGARILGGITIGHGAAIGANAVVVDDVPARATAAGVPATLRSGTPRTRRD